ncbi:hypothetical protein Tco_1079801 [Tanacetum coccineum]|uniref:Uncharacterized protein n=1 Tax=Tanacetum coccineum TaxID=301880 RepID=A0ABQ5HU01_9ASTR
MASGDSQWDANNTLSKLLFRDTCEGDVLGLLDSGGAHNFAQPNAGTGSEVVAGLSKEFQEVDMVDALSRVVEQKS